jgi:hypothetical protein
LQERPPTIRTIIDARHRGKYKSVGDKNQIYVVPDATITSGQPPQDLGNGISRVAKDPVVLGTNFICVGYKGADAANVKWIQTVEVYLTVILKDGKDYTTRDLPGGLDLPIFPATTRVDKTSGPGARNLYLDAVPGNVYYHTPKANPPGAGGIDNTNGSFIADEPGAIRAMATRLDADGKSIWLTAGGWAKTNNVKQDSIVGMMVRGHFTDIAVTVPNNVFVAYATWDARYAVTTLPMNQRDALSKLVPYGFNTFNYDDPVLGQQLPAGELNLINGVLPKGTTPITMPKK